MTHDRYALTTYAPNLMYAIHSQFIIALCAQENVKRNLIYWNGIFLRKSIYRPQTPFLHIGPWQLSLSLYKLRVIQNCGNK